MRGPASIPSACANSCSRNPLVDADTARALMGQGVIIDNQSDLIGPPGAGPKPTVPNVAAGLYNALIQGAHATDAGLGRMAADYLGMPEQAERYGLEGRRAANRIALTHPDFDSTGATGCTAGWRARRRWPRAWRSRSSRATPSWPPRFTLGQFGVNQTAQDYNKYRDRGASIGRPRWGRSSTAASKWAPNCCP
jgi:hypothetical protein